jgi:branched-chain amino acid transport system ATP-binding protein
MPDRRRGGREVSVPELLKVENMAVSYGSLSAVEGISLSVDEGNVHVILGSNGAGKTSVLRGISGFWRGESGRVTAGKVCFAGVDITGRAPRKTAARGVVLIPQNDKVFAQMSVKDNLRALPRIGSRRSRAEILATIFELFPILGHRKTYAAGYLSGGERQLLGIARGLLLRPRLLLIDEASLGLSPIAISAVFGGLRDAAKAFGTTLLMVEQNVGAALDIASRVHLMEAGRMIFSGTPDDVRSSERIRRIYLGLGGSVDLQ